ncbi:MAG: hypothetical protein WA395_02650 [Nitrososphaeraceae archaeon]
MQLPLQYKLKVIAQPSTTKIEMQNAFVRMYKALQNGDQNGALMHLKVAERKIVGI